MPPDVYSSSRFISDFHIFQYFISVVATTYIDAGRRKLDTNQYSVTDMARETEHGKGVPGKSAPTRLSIFRLISLCTGIFFKYDIEPMALTIAERTMSLLDFILRLAGIVGGILVCSGYAWRGGLPNLQSCYNHLTPSSQSATQPCEQERSKQGRGSSQRRMAPQVASKIVFLYIVRRKD